ncbi:membrane protein of unknown function [Candidatus Hydrogenisulfobacillus filiaventi]|uniref:Uncharacterized protein n=1 Tax=Candidatus Hydrogenisulfobacillus filiaventi TaxID=2707344 RepID=A0A6F8ZKA0_9FIRM|nr:hypothetical protein [Bacillota bacterium]CAB1130190.1 membrane protein of unknown function [Candidatus Hydrogenisulfobacillus filiaventi]
MPLGEWWRRYRPVHLSWHPRRWGAPRVHRWGGRAGPASGPWPVAINGAAATLIFRAVLATAAWAGAPPLNPELWLGTFFTADLPAAAVVGTVVMLAAGAGTAALYHALRPYLPEAPLAAGMRFGLGLWLVTGLIGFPVFAWLSPMVNNGLLLDPGAFGLGFGVLDAVILLLAYLVLGTALALGQALWMGAGR